MCAMDVSWNKFLLRAYKKRLNALVTSEVVPLDTVLVQDILYLKGNISKYTYLVAEEEGITFEPLSANTTETAFYYRWLQKLRYFLAGGV